MPQCKHARKSQQASSGFAQVSQYRALRLIPGAAGSGLLGIGATVVQCTIACDATNQGTVQGEPHFVGFDGSRYDFQGKCKLEPS